MNPNMAHFARMAAPQMQGRAMAPPQGYSAPSMPPRPPMDPAAMMAARGMPPGMPMPGAMPGAGGPPGMPPGMNPMAAKGRGGDSMMAHMTPGEIAVPPQVQTPEVLAALNKAFSAAGADPTQFQVGNPDQKVNPETGVPEFSFFDTLLPIGLGIAGSAIGGPVLGAGLADLGVGATTAGILGGALGGGLGSTAGNLIQGKPLGQAAAMGAGSAIGSGIGGAIGGGASSVNDIVNNFGGVAPVAQVGPGAGQALDLSDISKNVAAANAASPDVMDRLMSLFGGGSPGSLKRIAGSAVGGAIGSGLAESMFSPPQPKPNLGPPLPPLSQTPGLSSYIGGGSPRLTGPIPQGAPLFPRQGYRPGIDPQFNYFSG